jgi:heavy metal sensor kinase
VNRWWQAYSVRIRLTLWYVLAMLIVLGFYAMVVFAFVRRSASDALDQRLRGDFQWAAAMVDETPGGGMAWYQGGGDPLFDEQIPWLQVWSTDGTLLYRTAEAERRPLAESRALAAQPDDRIVSVLQPSEVVPFRVLTRRGRIQMKPVVIQVAASEAQLWDELSELRLILVFGLPLAVALAGLGGYSLARGALAPVERMTERARSITADRLGDRLPVDHPDDEMGRLATVFNETLARLQESFEQMRRFTADVSHELRTPLTAIRSVGEVGLRGHKDEAGYRSIIGSMLEEVDRLAGLVDRLLTLSRAETGQAKLSIEPIDLGGLATDVISHLGVLAEERAQTLLVARSGSAPVLADRQVLRQALINLVDNAIKFTPIGGTVRILLSETPAEAICDVEDGGHGIAPEAQAHIFDRFFRAGDATPGTGLGLSIAKRAVEANGGHLTLHSSGPNGSTFRLTVPRRVPAH